MRTSDQLELENHLILAREKVFKKIEAIFTDKAIEAHVFGSIARGDSDAYGDIDIWFTFKDEVFDEVYKNRFDYYSLIGEVIHLCEPPQNAPEKGVHTALLIQFDEAITVVDIYLCPLSTAHISGEGKKLFGIDLPVINAKGFNQKKVQVDIDYRVDFFIGFIFNTIKKIARGKRDPFEAVLHEYRNLHASYGVKVEPLDNEKQDISTLEKIIENIKRVANEKQRRVLVLINDFAKKLLS